MAKDKERYKYIEIGLEWHSETLEALEKDAKHCQMSDLLAKLVVIRLTEYYDLVKKGVILPGGHSVSMTPAASDATQAVEAASFRRSSRSNGKRAKADASSAEPSLDGLPEMTIVDASEVAGDNADAALDYYFDDEEEE